MHNFVSGIIPKIFQTTSSQVKHAIRHAIEDVIAEDSNLVLELMGLDTVLSASLMAHDGEVTF